MPLPDYTDEELDLAAQRMPTTHTDGVGTDGDDGPVPTPYDITDDGADPLAEQE